MILLGYNLRENIWYGQILQQSNADTEGDTLFN